MSSPAADRAQLYLERNRPKEALRALYAGLAEDPDDVVLIRLVAHAHLIADTGRTGALEAIPVARHAVALDPDNAFAYRIPAVAYARTGAHGDARRAARAAQRLNPLDWSNHTAVANADAASGYIDHESKAAVAEAIRLAPNQPEVYFSAARVESARHRPRATTRQYARVLELDPDHEAARNNLAVIQLGSGNLGGAAAGFVGILSKNPDSALALRNLRMAARGALRIINVVLWVAVIVGRFQPAVGPGIQSYRIVVAAVATVSIVSYLVWVRARAGAYFARFVRSVPHTDRILTGWALVLLACLIGIDCAAVTPAFVGHLIYNATQVVLILALAVVWVSTAFTTRAAR